MWWRWRNKNSTAVWLISWPLQRHANSTQFVDEIQRRRGLGIRGRNFGDIYLKIHLFVHLAIYVPDPPSLDLSILVRVRNWYVGESYARVLAHILMGKIFLSKVKCKVYTSRTRTFLTSMLVLLIVGPKCTLAASHAARCKSRYADGGETDGRTDAKPLHYKNVIIVVKSKCRRSLMAEH